MGIEKPIIEYNKKAPIFGQRHVQTLLMFFGMVFGYFLHVNMSVALLPLTDTHFSIKSIFSNSYDEPLRFVWDSYTISLIMNSFFWGYLVAQLPSGLLVQWLSAKIILGISTAVASVLTILHPVAIIYGGWKGLVAIRVITGFTQGAIYPCLHTLLAKWVPCTERGFLVAFVYSGTQLGSTIILATNGKILNSLGWPGVFYISGGITIIWALAFLYFGANEPAGSKYISKLEREYIESLTGTTTKGNKHLPVPWIGICTSLPFLGLIAAHCGYVWGFYTLATQLPSYMRYVLQMDVKSNALLSALPYFTMWILSLFISLISDILINYRIISVSVSRKIFNSIGLYIPMVCLIALGYMTKEQWVLAIVLLTVAVGFNAAAFCGYLVNHMDLSPNFAGLMMSISNGISNLSSICAPLVVGVIVKNEEDPKEWRIVFFITAGIYLICNLIFIIFGKGNIQPWNEPENSSRSISTQRNSRPADTGLNA